MRKLEQNIVSLTEQVDFHMPKKKKKEKLKWEKQKMNPDTDPTSFTKIYSKLPQT